jgi:hypothetical protein
MQAKNYRTHRCSFLAQLRLAKQIPELECQDTHEPNVTGCNEKHANIRYIQLHLVYAFKSLSTWS